MGIEIERKFLVKDASWREEAGAGVLCRQGYLVGERALTVRVRVMGELGFLTIKGETNGIRRTEFEYAIPVADAEALLLPCGSVVEKRRYRVERGAHVWEIDEFSGNNEGLVVAEIELSDEAEAFEKPSWLGAEVSLDRRYSNARLAVEPFSSWSR
jgi:adenylate cyclase